MLDFLRLNREKIVKKLSGTGITHEEHESIHNGTRIIEQTVAERFDLRFTPDEKNSGIEFSLRTIGKMTGSEFNKATEQFLAAVSHPEDEGPEFRFYAYKVGYQYNPDVQLVAKTITDIGSR